MRKILASILFCLFLAACSSQATPSAEPPAGTPEPTETAVPTAGPTYTPAPPLAILLIPSDLNDETSNIYQSKLYDLTQSISYRFQVRNELTQADLTDPSLKIVVVIPPVTDLKKMAADAPQVQFLAVNVPDIQAGGNISVLGSEGIRIEHQAFVAGYIGAMITEDYHLGILVHQDTTNGTAAKTAYRAGHDFYCGLCRPYAPPFEDYPLEVDVPADAKPAEYGAYADFLLRKKVDTIFIEPGLDSPELLEYLNSVGAYMIGAQSPVKRYDTWIVTLQPNYIQALEPAFLEMVAGQGGKLFSSPLTFTDINEQVFTPGKQNLAMQVMKEMFAGFIDIGVKP